MRRVVGAGCSAAARGGTPTAISEYHLPRRRQRQNQRRATILVCCKAHLLKNLLLLRPPALSGACDVRGSGRNILAAFFRTPRSTGPRPASGVDGIFFQPRSTGGRTSAEPASRDRTAVGRVVCFRRRVVSLVLGSSPKKKIASSERRKTERAAGGGGRAGRGGFPLVGAWGRVARRPTFPVGREGEREKQTPLCTLVFSRLTFGGSRAFCFDGAE